MEVVPLPDTEAPPVTVPIDTVPWVTVRLVVSDPEPASTSAIERPPIANGVFSVAAWAPVGTVLTGALLMAVTLIVVLAVVLFRAPSLTVQAMVRVGLAPPLVGSWLDGLAKVTESSTWL